MPIQYVDIDQHPIVVDMLRLKNRELLQSRASSVLAIHEERRHSEQFNCLLTENVHQSAMFNNNFGSINGIQNASKFGDKKDAFMNYHRSALDLSLNVMNSYACQSQGGKTKSQQSPAPFPTHPNSELFKWLFFYMFLLHSAQWNSSVKSCKKIIAQNRRAISPNCATTTQQFPRNCAQKIMFNRANSCQSLLNFDEKVSTVQSNKPMNNCIK